MNIEIIETVYYIDVELAIMDNISTMEIETSNNQYIEVNSDYAGTVVFASDITGLDDYIANFIDNYEIDCGQP